MRVVGPVMIEIHDEILFAPGGMIRRWANSVARENERNTRKAAPLNKRTRKFASAPPIGTLKRLISSEVTGIGMRTIDITTSSGAPYTIYVVKGTRTQYKRDALGRFGSAYPDGFPLPSNNFGKFRRVQRIRGQQANNFFEKGMQMTSVKHPSIRTPGLRFF